MADDVIPFPTVRRWTPNHHTPWITTEAHDNACELLCRANVASVRGAITHAVVMVQRSSGAREKYQPID